MSRSKTISNTYFDDEVLGRLPNGDLILKMGVKRKSYTKLDLDLSSDSQINYDLLERITIMNKLKANRDVDCDDKVDNWDTE